MPRSNAVTDPDPLADRFAAIANTDDTSDWLDVRSRARAFEPPRAHARRRAGWVAVAAAVVFPLGAVGAAAVGLGGPFGDIFGGEPEAHFRYHDGRQIPIYFSIGTFGESASEAQPAIKGKVWMAGVTSLELRFADGKTAAVPLDANGFFRYAFAARSEPTELVARNAQGNEVYNVPIPPGHTSGAHTGARR